MFNLVLITKNEIKLSSYIFNSDHIAHKFVDDWHIAHTNIFSNKLSD